MLFNYYCALHVVCGGKFLLYAKLNCNSLEVFAVTCYSCVAKAYCTGYFTGKVS